MDLTTKPETLESVEEGLRDQIYIPPLLTWEIENGNIPLVLINGVTLDQMREMLAEARKRLETAKREVDAWEQVVAVEESKVGIERPQAILPNKSEILRQFLRAEANRQRGVTYKMIRKHYEDKGIPMGTNFIYNLIDKWEEKDQVEKRENRIFWKGV